MAMPSPVTAPIADAATLAAASPRGTRLTIRGLGKRYGRVTALDDIDLDIPPGELVALLGPSGSGKTTLLRVVGGLLAADTGRVLFDDVDATRLSLRERGIGFVFQHYALFRHMTVAENVAFGLRSRPRAQRPSKPDIARRVDELLALVQLPDHGGRYPDQLSGGQKQRIALARALAIEPRVLLLDEPFGALDAKVRVELRRWLRALHERTGQTTLFVTHDQDEALELADRIVLMREGRIEQVGTPEALHDAPRTAFAYDFIGESCRLDGEVASGAFMLGGERVWGSSDVPDGPASLHFRPREARLVDTGRDGLRIRVAGQRRIAGDLVLDARLGTDARRVELRLPAESAGGLAGGTALLVPRSVAVFPTR
ncbi:sulfate/molybdate ABC transporter ATP-binding protein [Lysobacter humi (ex Lee et al. 2017)]